MDSRATPTVRIGVLAMQGAFAEHVRMLRACGADAFEVRTLGQLERCDGVVLPGGESTAIRKALDRCELLEPLRERVAAGLPTFGTCAGMIVLADTAPDGAPPCFSVLDVEVERNGFGRQVFSFEADVTLDGHDAPVHGVFIRAPRIARTGDGVEVVGRIASGQHAGEPVVVAQGTLLAASFHPELTADTALHERFVEQVRARLRSRSLRYPHAR
jgi:5'-phosphate synthase pdxT subunit